MSEVQEQNDLDKIIEKFFNDANIHHLTELSKDEVTAFSILGQMAEQYNLPPLSAFLKKNLKLRVSHKRAGRKEFVRITQRREDPPQDPYSGGFFSRFRRD